MAESAPHADNRDGLLKIAFVLALLFPILLVLAGYYYFSRAHIRWDAPYDSGDVGLAPAVCMGIAIGVLVAALAIWLVVLYHQRHDHLDQPG
jgi:uncharacterized membrane protein YfcA